MILILIESINEKNQKEKKELNGHGAVFSLRAILAISRKSNLCFASIGRVAGGAIEASCGAANLRRAAGGTESKPKRPRPEAGGAGEQAEA